MRLSTLMYVATVYAAATVPLIGEADTAVFQEAISDANGPNPSYNMEVGYLTSGFGGVLGPNDANHQIGGLATNWGRVVLRWDISSLAGKGDITAARAKITFNPVVRAEGFADVPNPFSYRLYRISDANKGWIDSQVHRDQPFTGGMWAGSDGLGTPGVDYLEPEISKVTFTEGMTIFEKRVLTFEFTDTSFLQDWVTNPANNAGFLLKSEELELAGSEEFAYAQGTMYPDDVTTAPGRYPDAVAADRPILELDFTPGAGLMGDYNNNGIVDAADYVVWRNGDSPDDTQAGYNLWKANFGKPGGAGSVIGPTAVPEASCFTLGILALCFGVACGRRAGSSRR